MFIDSVKIKVKAGDGGRGIVAFRREKYVPLGGPSGGDGGKGGDIVFVVDTNKSTLLDLRYQKQLTATNGQPGKSKKMHGANGEDIVIKVPAGTLIFDDDTNKLLVDLVHPNQKAIIANGGKGGRGNWHFASGRNNAPDYAEQGQLGQRFNLRLELKLLADAGLIGFPSVGKSTLLSVVSAAKPQIADYEFTTLVPNLGIVSLPDGYNFVLADLPGLIEGASDGKGLGTQFLKHIERCKVLIHVIDMSGEKRDPVADFQVINDELKSFRQDLLDRPMIVVANKMDGDKAQENLLKFKKTYPDMEVFETIAPLQEGLTAMLYKVEELIKNANQVNAIASTENEVTNDEFVTYKYEKKAPDFSVERINDHMWAIHSEKAEHMLETFDFDLPEHIFKFGNYLKKLGIDQALRDRGAKEGDIVLIKDFQFEFTDQLDY